MATATETPTVLNSLLRGEMSACETYQQALPEFKNDAGVTDQLSRIHREHQDAVAKLKSHVRYEGGEPSEGSGPWGWFASTVTGVAKLIGPDTTLGALKKGEQHGINQYEAALQDETPDRECRFLISNTLLPQCREHIAVLERLHPAK